MSWKKHMNAKPAAALAPEWFIHAKDSGCSEAELLEKVRLYCATLKPNPDEHWVKLMHGMYEAACKPQDGKA